MARPSTSLVVALAGILCACSHVQETHHTWILKREPAVSPPTREPARDEVAATVEARASDVVVHFEREVACTRRVTESRLVRETIVREVDPDGMRNHAIVPGVGVIVLTSTIVVGGNCSTLDQEGSRQPCGAFLLYPAALAGLGLTIGGVAALLRDLRSGVRADDAPLGAAACNDRSDAV